MSSILSVGLPEFKSQYDLTNLDSSVKFDNFDVVVFDSLHYLRNALPKNSDYLSADITDKVNSNLTRRASEIWNFIENGGLVIYFPHSKLEYKGYLSNSVKTLSFGDMIFEKNLTPSVGQKLQITNKINGHIRNFLDSLQGMLIHRVILPNYAEYEACLESKDQGQIVGSYKLHDSGGAIIVLPTLSFSNEENIETFINAIKVLREQIPSRIAKKIKVDASKSDVAVKLSPPPTSKLDTSSINMAPITELIVSNENSATRTSLPQWHTDYVLPEQKVIADSIVSLEEEINNLQDMLNAKKTEFKDLNSFKLLVTSQGKALEKIVASVLISMGFKVQEGSGKGDLIAMLKDQVLLIEVRGREGKGALDADAAGLERRAAKYLEDNNKPAKALLIVNGYLDLSLTERQEDIFPASLVRYSSQRDHLLFSGLQLLCLYADYLKNPDKQSHYLDKIMKTIGVLPDYSGEGWKKVISVVSETNIKVPA